MRTPSWLPHHMRANPYQQGGTAPMPPSRAALMVAKTNATRAGLPGSGGKRLMSRSLQRLLAVATAASIVTAAGLVFVAVQADTGDSGSGLAKINHLVVIYEENHSFDNLYGAWEGVNGRANADPAHAMQIGQLGAPYTCLRQDDLNLATPPLLATCTDKSTGTTFSSAFTNQPFGIEAHIPASAQTCPKPGVSFVGGSSLPSSNNLPGGCTRDVVHKFYQEQYQLNNGRQNRYVTGSDAIGLTMGYYDTSALPIYEYLHDPAHPHYAIPDDFFQGAFAGSFLNPHCRITAATPTYPNAPMAQHSILDANAMPTSYGLYWARTAAPAQPLTQLC